jgi:hypothetical protein
MSKKAEIEKIKNMLRLDNPDVYELDNPREVVDFSYFGDEASYLQKKNVPPLKVYIYGNYPHFEKATAYFMLRKAGASFFNKFDKNADIGWFWDSQIKLDKKTDKLFDFSRDLRFVNLFLVNTSKEFVAKSMEEHFGYTFKINPKTFNGYCIAKHNGNGTKSCFFLKCPINADEVFHDHCYQKIINYTSKTDSSTLYEIRVPIFKNIIPFTFFKTRNKGLRFTSKNRSMEIVPATAHLSEKECQDILSYCRNIGLEYGEIDILRSDDDGKIYIIDVNNTPWWPPNKLSDIDRNIALNMMWNSWIQAFLPENMNTYYIPDEHLDDFVNYKKPDKNNRNKKIINQSQFRFVGKEYEFPYKQLRDQLYTNYKKKPVQDITNSTSTNSTKTQEEKPKWLKSKNGKSNNKKHQDGKPQDGKPQDGKPQDGKPQDGKPQGKPQDGKPQDGKPQDAKPQGKPQATPQITPRDEKHKKFQNKSK